MEQTNTLLTTAILIAKIAHAGAVDKGGHPYIEHPLKLVSWLQTDKEKIVAALHDVLEDSIVTETDLRPIFGDEITDAVVSLTKKAGEPYYSYIKRVSKNSLAVTVKKADLRHNMDLSRLPKVTRKDIERVGKRYKIAYRILTRKQEDYTIYAYPECQYYYDKARNAEMWITNDMLQLSVELGFRLYDLENSIKDGSHVEDKIRRRLQKEPNILPVDCVKEMGDIIRYRVICSNIRDMSEKITVYLQKADYTICKVDDKYQCPDISTGYKGFHIDVVNPDGIRFEIQICSKSALSACEKSHFLYEKIRDVNCPESERQVCLKMLNDIWAEVDLD